MDMYMTQQNAETDESVLTELFSIVIQRNA
jgi:hypothetical protein